MVATITDGLILIPVERLDLGRDMIFRQPIWLAGQLPGVPLSQA
ncbi:hypothetical protein CAter10_3328 [Collimonas arenae]|nr:hypothetical protein CAter10_3328 [Collimonas arenae]